MSKYITDIYSAPAYHWLMFLKYNDLGFLKKESLNIPPHKTIKDNSQDAIDCYIEFPSTKKSRRRNSKFKVRLHNKRKQNKTDRMED